MGPPAPPPQKHSSHRPSPLARVLQAVMTRPLPPDIGIVHQILQEISPTPPIGWSPNRHLTGSSGMGVARMLSPHRRERDRVAPVLIRRPRWSDLTR